MNALGENRRAFSSQAGGRTYDGGSATGGGTAGVDAGLPSGGPGVNGSGGAQPTSTPNTAAGTNEFEPPPTPAAKNVTPYQKSIDMAAMLLAAAGALIMAAFALNKSGTAQMTGFPKVLAIMAGVLGLAIVAIGALISGGKYGQPMQGGLLALAGAGIAGMSYLAVSGGFAADGTTNAALSESFMTNLSPLMYIFGAAAVIGGAGALLTKPKVYPASEFEGRKVPDVVHQVKPMERARYTV